MRERATQAARAGTRAALKRLARPRSHATHVAPRSAAGAQPGARVAQPPPRVSVAHIKSGLRCATEGDAGAQRCCLTATAALRQSSRHHRAPPPLRPPRPRCPCGLRARTAAAARRTARVRRRGRPPLALRRMHFDLAPTHHQHARARATCPRPRTSPRTSMVRHWGELRESGSVARPHPRARPPPPHTHTRSRSLARP